VIEIEHLFMSPGHNYFGHHAKPAANHLMLRVPTVDCVAGRGIAGDRFFDHKPDYNGQITLFATEVFEQLCAELGLADADAGALRRNVVTRGMELNRFIGREFTLQGVRFVGTEECRPCYWMNSSLRNPTAETWLKGRGGLRAKILSSGPLQCG